MSNNLRDSDGNLFPMFVGAEGTVSVVTAGSTSSQTAAFGASTTLVRVATALNNNASHCHYLLGTNPTATTTTCSMLPAGQVQYLAVAPGQKLAFIRGANADISITVTEIAD